MTGKLSFLLTLIFALNTFLFGQGLRCLTCDVQGKRTLKAALDACRSGPSRVCSNNQQSCETETRFNDKKWSVSVKCKQYESCDNNQKNNPRDCTGGSNSVCRYCCKFDKCIRGGTEPIPKKQCKPLPKPQNGIKRCDRNPPEGQLNNICNFGCRKGFRISGMKKSVCRNIKGVMRYSYPNRVCKKVNAPPRCSALPSKPTNGGVACNGNGEVGTVCTFTCSQGYDLSGTLSTVCQRVSSTQATWSQYSTTCVKKSIDPCANNRCHKNARCVAGTGGCHTCECLPGYVGNGIDCKELDICRCNDCDQHATCIPNQAKTGYYCRCKAGYSGTGRNCKRICRPRPMDLAFVLDGSGSVGLRDFEKTKNAVKDIVSHLTSIGSTATQVAVIQYGKVARQEFSLRTHTTKAGIETAIDNISYMNGTQTQTGEALKMLTTTTFTAGNGARFSGNVAHVAIVITDGQASNPADLEVKEKSVKDAGIEVYAIGVGGRVVDDELLKIASEPKISHRFNIDNYDKINELYAVLQEQICDNGTAACAKLPETPGFGSRVCVGTGNIGTRCNFKCNSGYELEGSRTTKCAANGQTAEWTAVTPRCVPICHPRPMDIGFILDGSGSVELANFKKTKDALKDIVSNLASVGSTATQVAVVQYGERAQQEFSLNQYETKAGLKSAIDRVSYMDAGQTQTGKGLEELIKTTFTAGEGARLRNDVAKVAIVITDGMATDPYDLDDQQKAVKDAGIEVFAVGVGNKIVDSQLVEIASEPKTTHRFNIDNFDEINQLYSVLRREICDNATCSKFPEVPDFGSRICVGTGNVGTICNFKCNAGYKLVGSMTSQCSRIGQTAEWTTNTPKCVKNCQPRPMDLAFVLDGSGSVKETNFEKTKDAVKDIVSHLSSIGSTATQVAVIQFGKVARQEFSLIQYGTKTETETAIGKISYMKGGTTQTGKALELLTTNTFAAGNGARFGQDVAHVAIVITDGRATNSTDLEVKQKIVKDAGIEVFAIGVGNNIVDAELVQLASEPKTTHRFDIDDYSKINKLYSLLEKEICKTDKCSKLPEVPDFGGRICLGAGKVGTVCNFTCNAGYTLDGLKTSKCAVTGQKIGWTAKTPKCVVKKTCHQRLMDVVLVVDGSGSVNSTNFAKTKKALKDMVNVLIPDGSGSTQIGLVQYGGIISREFALNQYSTKVQLNDAIDNVTYQSGGATRTGAALAELRQHSFTQQNGARASSDVKKIAIVITDGQASDEELLKTEEKLVKAAGIEVFAVGVGVNIDDEELELIASKPKQNHVLEISSYTQIEKDLKSLTEEICNDDKCSSLPLAPINGQLACIGTGNTGTVCTFDCDDGFELMGKEQTICEKTGGKASWTSQTPACITKKSTKKCYPRPMDIVFVLDGSRSVEKDNFTKMKEAVINVIERFDSIGSASTEVGMLQFGVKLHEEFPLGRYQTKASLKQAIENVVYEDGLKTNTALALKELVTRTFTTQNGARMRPDVAKITVIITDGEPTDENAAREWQTKVKDSGIEIFAIGVGKYLDEAELRRMASDPKDTHTYKIANFSRINELYSLLSKEICENGSQGN